MLYLIRYETVNGCFFYNKEKVNELILCAADDEEISIENINIGNNFIEFCFTNKRLPRFVYARAKSIRKAISPVLKNMKLCKGTSGALKKEIKIERI